MAIWGPGYSAAGEPDTGVPICVYIRVGILPIYGQEVGVATKSRPSRVAAEAKTGSDSDVVPLGQRTLGSNDGTPTVSLPKGMIERLGMVPGDNLELGYDAEADEFRVRRADGFEGWD